MAADELSLYQIRDIVGLEEGAEKEERRTGAGSYGYVFHVSVGGVQRIAKKLHSNFVNPSQVSVQDRESITSKFRNECVILSKLRHPNIVQFIGVHYGRRGKTDLTLIMESVSSDMDKFLEVHRNVPLPLKLSILLDISYGLVYLHECNPPIVHRDLTARNVLITNNCQAKIADLGMAKIVDIQAQLAASHTQTPGQMFYMPPEALKEKASCTPKLDIFSFGHLTLYAVNQEFPKVYNITLTMEVQRQGIIEKLKRQSALDRVGLDHCLYPVITNCLYDNPEYRPNTRALNRKLMYLSSQNPSSMESVLHVKGSGTDQATIRELRQRIVALEQEKDVATPLLEHYSHATRRKDVIIKKEITRGFWGTVYAGEFRGCKVAIKQLHPQITSGTAAVDQMKCEARIMAGMHHPNIATFIGAVFDNVKEPMIIMELMETNLRVTHNTSYLSKDQKLSIFEDIACALDYLHELKEPIIHRKVSSLNVLIRSLPKNRFIAKVSSFEAATLEKLADTCSLAEGNPTYSAPEGMDAEHVFKQTVKMDTYSYGILLCEVVNRELLDIDSRNAMVESMAEKWRSMHSLVLRCIRHDPTHRPTMMEIIEYLKTSNL